MDKQTNELISFLRDMQGSRRQKENKDKLGKQYEQEARLKAGLIK